MNWTPAARAAFARKMAAARAAKARNPYWIEGSGRRFTPKAVVPLTATQKDVELAQLRGIEYEEPADAKRRRAAERRSAKVQAQLDAAAAAPAAAPKRARGKVKRTRAAAFHAGPTADDDLRTIVGKLGGLNRADAARILGPHMLREFGKQRAGIRPIVAAKGKPGVTMHKLGETLRALGFPVAMRDGDAGGDVRDLVADALLSGDPVYGLQAAHHERELHAQLDAMLQQQREPAPVTNPNRLDALQILRAASKKGREGRVAREIIRRAAKAMRTTPRRVFSMMREKLARRRRNNPELLTLLNPTSTAALAAFRKFHRVEPSRVRKLPAGWPDLVSLGTLREVVYKPTHGARKGPAFVHKFEGAAQVAATPDGRHVFLIPDPTRPFRVDWERGFVERGQ